MLHPARASTAEQAASPSPRAPADTLVGRLNRHGVRLIMLADAGAIAAALVAPMLVRHGLAWPSYRPSTYALGYTAVVVVYLAAFYFSGLYERSSRVGASSELPAIARAAIVATLIVALLALLTGAYLVPRGNLPFVLLLAAAGVTGARALSARVRARREGPPRVLLVGGAEDVALARRHLSDAGTPLEVVGSHAGGQGLLEAVETHAPTDLLLVSADGIATLYPSPLLDLDDETVGVLARVTARDTLLGLRSLVEVGGMPFTRLRTTALPPSRARAKRFLEVVLLLLGAPVAVPLFLLTAGYVRLVAGRPIFFFQDRVGRGGVVFRMRKFRTMRPDAEQAGEVIVATRDDPRIVRGCRWLRTTRLDELPQLWHVVTGEMTLVGPRPERPENTATFDVAIPGYRKRHELAPGLTGLAQTYGRYHTDPSYKLGYDLQYLVNWSPLLDLQILLRTVWVVLTRQL